MFWNLVNLAYRSLNISRWNNYPRLLDYVESEHIALKLHIAYVITNILRQKWKKIDLVYIYKNIYWSSFFTFIYSDIKYDVKKILKEKKPLMYKKLRQNLWDFLCSLNLDEKIKHDIKSIIEEHIQWNLFNQDYKIEHDIINLTKAIETKLEINDNVKIYSLSYENIPEIIDNDIRHFSKKLWFTEMEILNSYLSYLIRLKFAYRWNRLKKITLVSVLSHLFLVFNFSYFLWLLKWFSNEEMEEILNRSLLHDLPEALTWDVITPTKKSVQWFKEVLEEIENIVVKEKLSSLFKDYVFKDKFEEYVLYPFKWNIWKIAKYSDNLSAMFEAKMWNNEDYFKIYKNIKNSLWLKNDEELDYILKYWVDYFEEDVETKWKKFIWIE